ncbi:MAG: LPXTG cell wall anchor domain-containing protein [Promethearchaeota archaeon]
MEEFSKLDKKIRNVSLLVILIAIIIIIFWMISYIDSPENNSPLLMAIGIALLLGGILLFTKVQYIILMRKRY